MAVTGRPIGSMIVSLDINSAKFTDGIKSITSRLSQVKSDMKAHLAIISDAGNEYEKAKAKIDGLTKTMELQKKSVETLTDEYKKEVAVNGEQSDIAVKTSTRLNKAIAQYAAYDKQLKQATVDMKAEESGQSAFQRSIDQVNRTIKSSTDAFKAQGNTMQASRAEYQQLGTQVKNYEGLLKSQQAQLKALQENEKQETQAVKNQEAALKMLRTQMEASEVSLKQYKNANDQTSDGYKKAKANESQLNAEMKKGEENLKSLTSAVRSSNTVIGEQKTKIKETESEMTVAQSRYDKLGKSVKGMSDDTARGIDGLNKFGKSAGDVGSKVSSAGQSMTAFSVVAGGAFIYGAKQASEFQNTMTRTKNLIQTSGETTKQAVSGVSSMTKDAQKYATQYGVSVQNIGAGYQDLVKRGYTSKTALAAMKSELQASVASGDDFKDTLTVSSQTLESFGMNTKNVANNTKQVVNTLAYTADKTATDFHSLGIGMSYVGGTAKQAGLSLADTSAALGVMSNHGLEADKAGTGLRKVINSLVSPTDSAASALQKYGVKTSDFIDKSGKLKSMSAIFQELNEHTKGLTQSGKEDLFHTIFGTTGQQAALALDEDSKKLSSLNGQIGNAVKNNYAQKLAAKNMETAQSQLKQFKATIQVLAIQFADTLLPAITSIAKGLIKILQPMTQMSSGMKKFVSYTILAVAALGPFLIALGSIITAIKNISEGLAWFKTTLLPLLQGGGIATFLTNPITLAVAAIVAVGAALVLAYNKVKPFRDAVNNLASQIKDAFTKVKAVIKDVFALFSGDGTSGKSYGAVLDLKGLLPESTVMQIVAGVNKIKSAFNGLKTFMNGTFNAMKASVKTITTIVKGLWTALTGSGKKATNILDKFFPKATVTWITANLKYFKSLVTSVVNSIKATFKSLINTVSPIFSKIGSLFRSMASNLVKWWNQYGNSLKAAFRNVFAGILAIVGPIINAIATAVSAGMKLMLATIRAALDLIKNVFSSTWNGIKTLMSGVFQILGGLLKVFAGAFTGNWREMWSGVKDIFKGVWDSLKGIAKTAIGAVIGVVNTGIDGINSVIHTFGGKAKTIGHIPGFAKGTPGHKGGPAMVNDAPGANYREMVIYPNNEAFIPQGRNVVIPDMPRGTKVITAEHTKTIMNGFGITHYASGIGSVWDSIKDTASGAASWVGAKASAAASWIGDKEKTIKKYLKDPGAALADIWDHFTSGFSIKGSFGTNFALGAGHYIVTQGITWFKGILKKLNDEIEAKAVGNPGGAGVTRWKSVIKKAAEQMHVNLTSAGMATILKRIAQESGGSATISNNWDSNAAKGTPSKGLLQYIQPTLDAWVPKGVAANLGSGWSQLMALFNDSNWLADISVSGGWGPTGHRRYANGGIINTHQIAEIGEGNLPEAIIPLDSTKRTRAMQILAKVKDIVGDDSGSSSNAIFVSNNNKQLEASSNQQNVLLQAQNQLLGKILSAVLGGGTDPNGLGKLTNMVNDYNLADHRLKDYTVNG